MKAFRLAAAFAVVTATLGLATPANACLSCGCGGSGSSSDLSAVGGVSALFSMGQRWLVQEGVSLRSITGSFNELGTWNPVPVDSSMRTVQSTLGLSYFPSMGTSVGVQIPMLANVLDQASWGPMGSIQPTDLGRTTGAALGDLAFQGSMRLYEHDVWAVAGWAGATVPTGNATGDPQTLSGAGVFSGSGGLVFIAQPGDWELTANLGYQQPFGRPTVAASTFYVGNALLYQVAVNRRINNILRLGLGASGFQANGRFGASDLPVPMTKIKVLPTVQVALGASEGLRLAVGLDPTAGGTNQMTDLSAYAVFYQYMR